jgi:hypothetical protein
LIQAKQHINGLQRADGKLKMRLTSGQKLPSFNKLLTVIEVLESYELAISTANLQGKYSLEYYTVLAAKSKQI